MTSHVNTNHYHTVDDNVGVNEISKSDANLEDELAKRQREEFRRLQQILQSNEQFHTMGPMQAVMGKSFTSTYNVDHTAGQSDKDLKMMNLE